MSGIEIIAGAGGFAVGALLGLALARRLTIRRSARELALEIAEYRMEYVGPEHEHEAEALIRWLTRRTT